MIFQLTPQQQQQVLTVAWSVISTNFAFVLFVAVRFVWKFRNDLNQAHEKIRALEKLIGEMPKEK